MTFEARGLQGGAALGDDVAAVIVEPLVQAAAGMRLVPSGVYEELRETRTLVICDEVATGFGRTGTMFAFEQTPLHPDILCVGKGLSGGTLALSATLVRREIYEAFIGDPAEYVQFFHGHSYAGNPIACAAALASLDLFEEEQTLARAAGIGRAAASRQEALRSHAEVREVRQAGTMIGIELASGVWPVADALYAAGHFTRPIGSVIQSSHRSAQPTTRFTRSSMRWNEACHPEPQSVVLSLSLKACHLSLKACHPELVEG